MLVPVLLKKKDPPSCWARSMEEGEPGTMGDPNPLHTKLLEG